MLENDVSPLGQTFETAIDRFGAQETIELIPDGRNILVTNDNKQDYVDKLASFKMSTTISEQIKAFLTGFYEIIPRYLVTIFTESELEILISGLSEVDVEDLKANTVLQGYQASSPQVMWLWRVLLEMTSEQRSSFWQFCTGSCKVPAGGFKFLEGQHGRQSFTVHKVPNSKNLPVSHTCFNQLDLPEYDTYETLKEKLNKAVALGVDHFGLV